jgi:hypothetical protein
VTFTMYCLCCKSRAVVADSPAMLHCIHVVQNLRNQWAPSLCVRAVFRGKQRGAAGGQAQLARAAGCRSATTGRGAGRQGGRRRQGRWRHHG